MSAKLLVVDDEPAIQRMVHKRARKDGFDVIGALTLRDGLRRALEDRPDVMLIDMSLPDGVGADLLAQLKADRRTCRIPIVMWSGLQSDEWQPEALLAGAIACLRKDDLILLMKTLMALCRGSERTALAASAPADEGRAEAVASFRRDSSKT